MSDFFWFSDAQWARIEPLLPRTTRGMKRVDDRRVLSGIVHALRCGGRWADCAGVYGPKKTLYNRFVRWSERGIWEEIFKTLAGADDAPDRLFIDRTCLKAHRCAGGGKGGPWLMVSAARRAGATPSSTPSATKKADLTSCSCRPRATSSPTRDTTARLYASGSRNAVPKPSSRPAETARSSTITTGLPINSAMSSNACSAASRTGGASRPASTATSKTSWGPSLLQPPSSGGCNESGPYHYLGRFIGDAFILKIPKRSLR
jgi:transposase